MVKVDCSELTQDEQLALASSISDALQGRGLALAKGDAIVVDNISGERVGLSELVGLVEKFVSRRKDSGLYSVERAGDTIVVHSPDPVAARRSRTPYRAPPGAYLCPSCGLVLPDEGKYQQHLRVHDLARGIGR